MSRGGGRICTSGSRAKVTPTAKASMLVAMAMGAMTFTDREQSAASLSGEKGTREGAAIAALEIFFYRTQLLRRLEAIEDSGSAQWI